MPIQIQKAVIAQRDFSGGQVDPELKRDDSSPIQKSGARQCVNFRLLNSKNLKNRPGRAAVYDQGDSPSRIEQVKVSSTLVVDVVFGGDGSLQIRDTAGAYLAAMPAASYPWASATVDQIVFCVVNINASDRDIMICFPGMHPAIARYSPTAGWSFGIFSFSPNVSGGVLAPFYRIAPNGITVQPSSNSGAITVHASAPAFGPALVGSYIRIRGAQVYVTGYTDSQNISGNTAQDLPSTLEVAVGPAGSQDGYFTVGQIVQGSISGYRGTVTYVDSVNHLINVIMERSGTRFFGEDLVNSFYGETISGPNGRLVPTKDHHLTIVVRPDAATDVWDEIAFGDYRGWPESCFFDQGRFAFTNLPSVRRGIAWTGFGRFYDFLAGATDPTDPIFELMSESVQIYNVVPGDGGELLFTDSGVWYVPISENNPLKPGSVSFKPISPEPSSRIRPTRIAEGVLYVNAGLNRIILVAGTGATYSVKPYGVRDISINHTGLFKSIRCIAVTMGDADFTERYIYALNADGGINVGRLELTTDSIGWTPWLGEGLTTWISARQSTVTMVTRYTVPGAGVRVLAERLDAGQYLDAAVLVNAAPPGMAPPGGMGPLWFVASGTVRLLDRGHRDLGIYNVDASGYLIPKFTGAEDLTRADLVAGQAWTATFEPFIAAAQPGQDSLQRMRRRRICKAQIYVKDSNGFYWAARRINPYNTGENQEIEPPLREDAYSFRQTGRDYDPRVTLVKDTPGPLTILEIALEVTT